MEYLRDVCLCSGPADIRANEGHTLGLDSASQRVRYHPGTPSADFIEQVFWNIHDLIVVNTCQRDTLNKLQKSYAIIEGIADIFRDNVPLFAPFVSYGAHQLYAKYKFEKEKSANLVFAQFVEVCTCPWTDHSRFDITV